MTAYLSGVVLHTNILVIKGQSVFVFCCCDNTLTKNRLWREGLTHLLSPDNCTPLWEVRKGLKPGAKQKAEAVCHCFLLA